VIYQDALFAIQPTDFKMCKYHLNIKEQGIVKSTTGEILRPACITDVIAYHSYLESTGKEKQAQELLKDIFQGERVISKMIEKMQNIAHYK
jgi:hypothetical protein